MDSCVCACMYVCVYVFRYVFCGVVSMRFSVFSCLCVCDPSMIGGHDYALHNLQRIKDRRINLA